LTFVVNAGPVEIPEWCRDLPRQSEETISYLIAGDQQALLFDTGMGIGDLKKVTAARLCCLDSSPGSAGSADQNGTRRAQPSRCGTLGPATAGQRLRNSPCRKSITDSNFTGAGDLSRGRYLVSDARTQVLLIYHAAGRTLGMQGQRR